MTAPDLQSPAWVEISIDLPSAAHEAMGGFLFDLGCEGVVTEGSWLKGYLATPEIDPLSIENARVSSCCPPLPLTGESLPRTRSGGRGEGGLFAVRARILLFLDELNRIFPEAAQAKTTLSLTPIENSNWGENWRRFFHPEKVTPRLWVAPPWEGPPPGWEGELIVMDPGPAFGTGRHATTRMCLSAIERAPRPAGWSMLDVGTGSGILAIYGAKLNAGRVLGVDNDPEALRWAERNIRINGLSGRIELTGTPIRDLDGPFSLITANLTMDVILGLLPSLARLLDAGGRLILSGLLRGQVERIRETLRGEGLPMGRGYYRGEWASVVTQKRAGAVHRVLNSGFPPARE